MEWVKLVVDKNILLNIKNYEMRKFKKLSLEKLELKHTKSVIKTKGKKSLKGGMLIGVDDLCEG